MLSNVQIDCGAHMSVKARCGSLTLFIHSFALFTPNDRYAALSLTCPTAKAAHTNCNVTFLDTTHRHVSCVSVQRQPVLSLETRMSNVQIDCGAQVSVKRRYGSLTLFIQADFLMLMLLLMPRYTNVFFPE